jgi:hypothetical protein
MRAMPVPPAASRESASGVANKALGSICLRLTFLEEEKAHQLHFLPRAQSTTSHCLPLNSIRILPLLVRLGFCHIAAVAVGMKQIQTTNVSSQLSVWRCPIDFNFFSAGALYILEVQRRQDSKRWADRQGSWGWKGSSGQLGEIRKQRHLRRRRRRLPGRYRRAQDAETHLQVALAAV